MVELDTVHHLDLEAKRVTLLRRNHTGLSTCSTAEVMASPITSSSLAASVAMRRRSSCPPTATASGRSTSPAHQRHRLLDSAPQPLRVRASVYRPKSSLTIACASTVAVVVPSPTIPLVCMATSLTS